MGYAVVFPGQGSQFVGMADGWVSDPAGKAVLDEASEAMGRDVVVGCHDEDALATTEFVQPALLACDVGAFEVMRHDGAVDPVGVAGHSLGEFAALVAGGAMSFRDALELVVIRGVAMQRAGEDPPGGMTARRGIRSSPKSPQKQFVILFSWDAPSIPAPKPRAAGASFSKSIHPL